MSNATRQEVEELRIRKSEDLCKLAEILGYGSKDRFAINQLQCNNGAFVSSLLNFLDDNPGCMEAIQDWVLENVELDEEEEEEEEEDEGEYLCDSKEECEEAEVHLRTVDDDGYCNNCGHQ